MTAIRELSMNLPDVPLFEALVKMEQIRRLKEASEDNELTLEQFEQSFFGPDVGYVRRAINAKMIEAMPQKGSLLDYGCGSYWWKEDYWPRFGQVFAAEVDMNCLKKIGEKFPQTELIYTNNGLIDLPESSFDCVLSSSVVGYILPIQAKMHLETCYRLLKPGGTFIFTRVGAFGLRQALRFRKMYQPKPFSFEYASTQRELEITLKAVGFKNSIYHPLFVNIPGVPWKTMQTLTKYFPAFMRDTMPRLLPFAKYMHSFVATK